VITNTGSESDSEFKFESGSGTHTDWENGESLAKTERRDHIGGCILDNNNIYF
jgi:hypothetical protein